jgi:hypothetical protein
MNIPLLSNMNYNSSLPGSTGANIYKNRTGKKWVIKQSKKGEGGIEQVIIESAANDIYGDLGIPVPKHYFDIKHKALILEYIDGKLLKDATPAEYKKAKLELQKGFIIDALLANWDVIGLYKDNIILPNDGSEPVRIDNGGSLTLKATGGKKIFTKTVIEIDTMRNKKISPQASEIFEDLSDVEIDNQIKYIVIPNYDLILLSTPDNIKETMKARLDYLVERTLWFNATTFKNTVKEQMIPEYIKKVQEAIIEYFKDSWLNSIKYKYISNNKNKNIINELLETINKLLIDYNAIIGGGFILKAIGAFVDENSVDMDIYVPTEYAKEFRKNMIKLFNPDNIIQYGQSDVSTSFFKKNGIVSVSKYSKNKPKYIEMDIVEVDKDRTPIDVIKNSDLTFCENWYDGKNVFMTHPEHVKTKNGFLENTYLDILFSGNLILINRIKKYIERGFKININNPNTDKIENITNDIIDNKIFKQQIQNQIQNIEYGSYGTTSIIITSNMLDNIKPYIVDRIEYNNNIKNNIVINKITKLNATKILTNSKDNIKLTDLDKEFIKYYSGTGYDNLNRFLYSNVIHTFDNNLIYKLLNLKFPRKKTESINYYNNRLYYYYFVNLYNAIQKGPIFADIPFKVYRGTNTWYLEKDKNKIYYINSFMSTSITQTIAKIFNTDKMYIFYVHPYCRYMNISPLSLHPFENEILLTPYHRYYYVSETAKYIKYIILPSDLNIPSTVDKFIEWKNNISTISKIFNNPTQINKKTVMGGRIHNSSNIITIKQTDPFFNIDMSNTLMTKKQKYTNKTIKNLKTTIILNKMNKSKMNKSKMNNKTYKFKNNEKTILTNEDTFHRFTDTIPSFPGNIPTTNEINIINKMIKLIENDIE